MTGWSGSTSRRRGISRPGLGLVSGCLLVAAATVTYAVDPVPTVTEVEIVPGTVAVAAHPDAPTTFVLEARLWSGPPNDRGGILESVGIPVTWTVSPAGAGLHLSGNPTGYFATLLLDAGTGPTSPVTVTAKAGGVIASSQIVPAASSSQDKVKAAYTAGLIPDAVVVRGNTTPLEGPCAVWLSPHALVRMGLADDVKHPCANNDPDWGVAVLDPAHRMEMYPMPWTPGTDQAGPATPTAMHSIPVAVRIFITKGSNLSASQNALRAFVQSEIADANTVFADGRAGVELAVTDLQIVPPPSPAGMETIVLDCAAGDALTAAHDLLATPPVLHVYIIDGTGGQATGFTCAATDQRPHPVIYLASGASGTILLHEAGHALGLDVPGAGHTDDIKGFDAGNVMAGGYADTDDVWRRRFTAGQAFRMNAELGSWLNWGKTAAGALLRENSAPRLVCQCGYDDPAGRCPRLLDDVARPRAGLGRLYPWDCGELIKLPPVSSSERPLALIGGRLWRTAPAACRADIPGVWEGHWNATYIKSENLTRPGSCPSWVAVFFPNHAPIFRDLSGEVWSDAADLPKLLSGAVSSPIPVTVHVYYNKKDDLRVTAGLGAALKAYSKANRIGVKLGFIRHTPLPPTCPPPHLGQLSICYSAVAGPNIPQLVGVALGLHVLTGNELTQPAFAGNTMLPQSGDKLTLGQVFRVHATLDAILGTGGFPTCAATGSVPCPGLEADVKQ